MYTLWILSEAIEAILIHSQIGEEILKRKKVRKENLLVYLAHEGHLQTTGDDKAF